MDIVTVRAADFNGSSFDSSPFSEIPVWLEAALETGGVTIKPDDRDYALWAVTTPAGVVVAEPGDNIVRSGNGELHVHKVA